MKVADVQESCQCRQLAAPDLGRMIYHRNVHLQNLAQKDVVVGVDAHSQEVWPSGVLHGYLVAPAFFPHCCVYTAGWDCN